MLALLGFLTVVTFLILIMTKRVSVTLALIVVPVITALIGGFAPKMGPMMVNGIKNVAPVGVMIMFAILYFGLMLEVGLFEPIVKRPAAPEPKAPPTVRPPKATPRSAAVPAATPDPVRLPPRRRRSTWTPRSAAGGAAMTRG